MREKPSFLRHPLLEIAGLVHAFSMGREDLGMPRGAGDEELSSRVSAFAAKVGFDPESLHLARQIHSDRVIVVGGEKSGKAGRKGAASGSRLPSATAGKSGMPGMRGEASAPGPGAPRDERGPFIEGEGDALITNGRGVFVGVFTADCVPVLVADPVHGAVAAVHAGWKGLLSGIIGKAIDRMRTRFGSDPGDILGVAGPAASDCCYEVDADLFERVEGRAAPPGPERPRLDLAGAAVRALLDAGIREESAAKTGICTICDGDLFSYRREGPTGRQLSVIGFA